MTEDTENLVLEQLRAMRTGLAGLKDDNTFIKARMSSIEYPMAGIHSDMATVNGRIDTMDKPSATTRGLRSRRGWSCWRNWNLESS